MKITARKVIKNVMKKRLIDCIVGWLNWGLTLSQTSPVFYVSTVQAFKNTVGKGEIAHNELFLLFPQCFLPLLRTFCHFYPIRNCRLQILLVWKSLNLSFGKELTPL